MSTVEICVVVVAASIVVERIALLVSAVLTGWRLLRILKQTQQLLDTARHGATFAGGALAVWNHLTGVKDAHADTRNDTDGKDYSGRAAGAPTQGQRGPGGRPDGAGGRRPA